ncbi:family 417, putative ATP binding protein [Pyrobaculum islandicum DSM 4184]|uniref:Family 417, putative ATP binding protein n=1 Tax=Pyrobaculum islandicum (strain DSM 4184 / JCM 9189 / GEO3) TaxID=384616 RepID=A1RRP6_PYRIL|nr:hypothetical protein [Pyrobaculum islandicum]ABL87628.1 family 417, putative ATP binding protein [Pyrobaculum islandicum DSM 4184]
MPEDATLLGVEELYKSQIVGIYGTDKRKLAKKLEELASTRDLFYLSLFPQTTLPVELEENRVKVATTFRDIIETIYNIYSGRMKVKVFVVSGIRDIERILGNDVVDYINAVASVARFC